MAANHSNMVLPLQHSGKTPPPSWAVGEHKKSGIWYFENEHGEPWVAKRDGDSLRIAGLETDWKEMHLGLEAVEMEMQRCLTFLTTGKAPFPSDYYMALPQEVRDQVAAGGEAPSWPFGFTLGALIVNDAEVIWLLSVFKAAIFAMQHARENTDQ